MAIKRQALPGVCYTAWDANANAGKTGDAANHTLRLVRDGTESIPTNSPSEVDSVNCPGLYQINLTSEEMNCNMITISGKSSSTAVSIIPVEITTSAS